MRLIFLLVLLLPLSCQQRDDATPRCPATARRIAQPVRMQVLLPACNDPRSEPANHFAGLRRWLDDNGVCRYDSIVLVPTIGRMIYGPCEGDFANVVIRLRTDKADLPALTRLGFREI